MQRISIHALLAESDRVPLAESTSESISIHALLAESDAVNNTEIDKHDDFYPRSPCGERQLTTLQPVGTLKISIHALLAESDDCLGGAACHHRISIHALLAESDLSALAPKQNPTQFLSTLSLRRATVK